MLWLKVQETHTEMMKWIGDGKLRETARPSELFVSAHRKIVRSFPIKKTALWHCLPKSSYSAATNHPMRYFSFHQILYRQHFVYPDHMPIRVIFVCVCVYFFIIIILCKQGIKCKWLLVRLICHLYHTNVL